MKYCTRDADLKISIDHCCIGGCGGSAGPQYGTILRSPSFLRASGQEKKDYVLHQTPSGRSFTVYFSYVGGLLVGGRIPDGVMKMQQGSKKSIRIIGVCVPTVQRRAILKAGMS